MRPGSVVLVRSVRTDLLTGGAHPRRQWHGGNPIKFIGEDGVRLTGTRVKPEPAGGHACRVGSSPISSIGTTRRIFRPGTRPSGHRSPPGGRSGRGPRPSLHRVSGRPFYLEFPIRYTPWVSVDQVEAQPGTIWNDTATTRCTSTSAMTDRLATGQPVSDQLRLGHGDD